MVVRLPTGYKSLPLLIERQYRIAAMMLEHKVAGAPWRRGCTVSVLSKSMCGRELETIVVSWQVQALAESETDEVDCAWCCLSTGRCAWARLRRVLRRRHQQMGFAVSQGCCSVV
jgi:hypothetical protein